MVFGSLGLVSLFSYWSYYFPTDYWSRIFKKIGHSTGRNGLGFSWFGEFIFLFLVVQSSNVNFNTASRLGTRLVMAAHETGHCL